MWQETAALRHFIWAHVRFGSSATGRYVAAVAPCPLRPKSGLPSEALRGGHGRAMAGKDAQQPCARLHYRLVSSFKCAVIA